MFEGISPKGENWFLGRFFRADKNEPVRKFEAANPGNSEVYGNESREIPPSKNCGRANFAGFPGLSNFRTGSDKNVRPTGG
jgi:hypothetical protein